jgi:sortase A
MAKTTQLFGELEQSWARPVEAGPGKASGAPDMPITLSEGRGFAILRIPAFGPGYHWIVVEGVNRRDLEEGPGHYPGTASPGRLGNVVISGHRTTYGHPFNRLNKLHSGDIVDLQVRRTIYYYRVLGTQVVDPADVAVTFPVPGHLGAKPRKRLLTMTTCNPEYSAAQRLVVTAELVRGTS